MLPTLQAALHHALTTHGATHGPPSIVLTDNGKDYQARVFHGVTKTERRRIILNKGYLDEAVVGGIFTDLGIDTSFSLPYNPNSKSRQERWYRTVDEQFCKLFATYCGNSPTTKPEMLSQIIQQPNLIPMFDDASKRFEMFTHGYNHNPDNRVESLHRGGEQLSPSQAMQQCCFHRNVLANPHALDLLLQYWHKPVTCGKNGITISPFGVRLTYSTDPSGGRSLALSRFKGLRKKDRELLHVSFNPHDLRSIRVYDSQRRFVAIVNENQLGGLPRSIDNSQLRQLIRDNRKYAKSLKVVQGGYMRDLLSSQEMLAQSVMTPPVNQPQEPAIPESLKIVQTVFDDQVKAVKRAETKRAFSPPSAGNDGALKHRPGMSLQDLMKGREQ